MFEIFAAMSARPVTKTGRAAGFCFIGACLILPLVSSCGSGATDHDAVIGGTVSGLQANRSIELREATAGQVILPNNGAFTFPEIVASGSSYDIAVTRQPKGQECKVSPASGKVEHADVVVRVECVALPYTVSVTVLGTQDTEGLVLENNGADPLAIATSGAFQFSEPVLNLGRYEITVASQPPGQTCMVQGGAGIVDAADVSVLVICPWHAIYSTANHALSGYYVDEATGRLSEFPSNPMAVLEDSGILAISRSGQHAYLVDQAKGTLVAFSVDRSTGALSRVEDFEIDVGNVDRLTATGSGDFLYAAGESGVRGFKIDTATGNLAEVPGSPYAMNYSAESMVAHPTEAYLYVLTADSYDTPATWLHFAIDAASGSLAPAGATGPIDGWYLGRDASIDPTGRFLYIGYRVDYGSSQHEVRTIEPGTGEVSASAQYGRGWHVRFSESGEFKYSREIPWDGDWSSLLSIKVDPVTGADLELVDELTFPADLPEVSALTVDPGGSYGYAMWGGVLKRDPITGKFLSVDRSFDSLGDVVVLTLR